MSGAQAQSSVVVEDGTGIASANSYVSTSFVDAYASVRTRSPSDAFGVWETLSQNQKNAAVILVSDYIDTVQTWSGTKAAYTNGLQWPRVSAFDLDAQADVPPNYVPKVIAQVAAEMAVKVAGGTTLLVDLARGGQIQTQALSGMSITYFQGAPAYTVYQAMGRLKGLIRNNDELPPLAGGQTATMGSPGFRQGMFDIPGRADVMANGGANLPAYGNDFLYGSPLETDI